MIVALLLALLGCAPKHSLEIADTRREVVCQFAIAAHGRSFAGLMAAVIEDGGVEVAALTPAGTELFRVARRGELVRVSAPDPSWEPWLERLPFDRDLPLVLQWHCPVARCLVEGGVLAQRPLEDGGVERRWRGPGGPVSATIHQGKAVVVDPRRGYTVTLAGEAIHVP
jgi:hypothetical protein